MIRPTIWQNFNHCPWGYGFLALGAAGIAGVYFSSRKTHDLAAFVSSGLFIAGMLAATAFGLFPHVLPSSGDPARSLTVYNTITHEYGLAVGIIWWTVGIFLAAWYFVFLFRSFRGKVIVPAEGEGY
jgi:cytochrome d ubiquinol oxidase subunit II